MDKTEFEVKLSAVAEWQIPKTMSDVREGSVGRGRPRKRTEQDQPNPTFPPQILRLKITDQCCGDCGRICDQGRKLDKRQYEAFGIRHWRQKCVTCQHFENPYTGKFDVKGTAANQVWLRFLLQKQRKKTDPQPVE